jgi:hypothetical protein
MVQEAQVQVTRLVRRWRREHGINRRPSVVERAAMVHAAQMAVFAETVRAAALAGSVTINDCIRAENAARRALRDMRSTLPKVPSPSLRDHLAKVRPLGEMIATLKAASP